MHLVCELGFRRKPSIIYLSASLTTANQYGLSCRTKSTDNGLTTLMDMLDRHLLLTPGPVSLEGLNLCDESPLSSLRFLERLSGIRLLPPLLNRHGLVALKLGQSLFMRQPAGEFLLIDQQAVQLLLAHDGAHRRRCALFVSHRE